MRITQRKLRRIIRKSITESMNDPYEMTPEEEDEYYDQLAAEYEEMEDGRYEREDAMYRKQMGESRRRRRRVLKESVKDIYGEIQNAILGAPSDVVGNINYNNLLSAVGTLTARNGEEYAPSQQEIDSIVIDMIKDGMLEIRPSSEYR